MFNFFGNKSKCPNCNEQLDSRPTRKKPCPSCGKMIVIRNGELLTEDDAMITDWLNRLEQFGISRNDFDLTRDKLSKKFGKAANINDAVWSILNALVMKYGNNLAALEQIYREMASLVSSEGRDPTQYLTQAEKARNRRLPKSKSKKQVFLGHDELAYVRNLRKNGKLDKAEELLLNYSRLDVTPEQKPWEFLEIFKDLQVPIQIFLDNVSPDSLGSNWDETKRKRRNS